MTLFFYPQYAEVLRKNQRSLKKQRDRDRSQSPKAWEEGSVERYLNTLGIPKEQVDNIVGSASSWRVTPAGRPLIDRRRRSRVQRNAKAIAEFLEENCSISNEQFASIISKHPQLLLCKPYAFDRWDRRCVLLAAYMHIYGTCDVPSDDPDFPDLGTWVQRQRQGNQQGTLGEERALILQSLGFDFREEAQVTSSWETTFKTLQEWLKWHEDSKITFRWNCLQWGKQGGQKARELAVWVQFQRELLRRQQLSSEAQEKLSSLGNDSESWYKVDQQNVVNGEDALWLAYFGQLLYVAQRRRLALKNRLSPDQIHSPRYMKSEDNDSSSNGIQWLDTLNGVVLSPAVDAWLESQRQLWRSNLLNSEKLKLFLAAGIDLNPYSLRDWRQIAHQATRFVNGFDIQLRLPHSTQIEESTQEFENNQDQVQNLDELQCVDDKENMRLNEKSSKSSDELQRVDDKQNMRINLKSSKNSEYQVDQKPRLCKDLIAGYIPDSQMQSSKLQNIIQSEESELIKHWIEVQQQMFRETRLSPEQIKYLAALGISWILSVEVFKISEVRWNTQYEELKRLHRKKRKGTQNSLKYLNENIWIFYQRQIGLGRLGFLYGERVQRLEALGIDWEFERDEDDQRWDEFISGLMEYNRLLGNCNVDKRVNNNLWEDLTKYSDLASQGQLCNIQFLQLKALDIINTQ
eukprot:TRINITY_DN12828_c0_g1_i4.p1 TRINITY_DN12828_c0_g1~~TRINITY_DN12828_c0_g1_i4.p1  ORF type:complete len:688 (+),score=102.98 TRINITY_DN12828_c0_g1_i4:364-2427(+)